MASDDPTVLVVDDEADVTEVYALWLSQEYEVRTATGGLEALDEMDDDVDAVLLDRRMPGMAGDEVLEQIREEGYDPAVAMVTAVDPNFDIVEMAFESYLTKPIMEDELREAVDQMLQVRDEGDETREGMALAEKRRVLESEKDDIELEQSDEFDELEERLERLQVDASEVTRNVRNR